MGVGIIGTLALIYLGFTVLFVAAAASIVRKAGYSGWWVAAGVVPLVNVVMLFAFAFADWPVLRDLHRAQSAPVGGAGHPGFSHPQAVEVSTTTDHPGFATQPNPEPAYAEPAYAEPAAAQPAYAVPAQPAPNPPPPRFPGYGPRNILPGG